MMAQIADITSIHTGEQLLPESLRQFAVRLILLVCSIVLVWTIVPALFSLQVLLALAAFTILLVISRDRFRAVLAAPALSAVRMLFFLVLECAVPILSKGHLRGAADASARGFLTPILRLAVLVPGLVLFPFAFWRRVAAVFRAEC